MTIISVEGVRHIYAKIPHERRFVAFQEVIANLLYQRGPERALGTVVARAVEPALKGFNSEDFAQLRYLWHMASPSNVLTNDGLTLLVLGCLDTSLDPTAVARGMSPAYKHMPSPSEERQKDITDLVRNRNAELGATRSRDDLNALLAVIVTVTAYAAHLIERVPSKLEKVLAKHPWIPKIQLT